MAFGKYLKDLRAEKGLTQKQLSEVLDVSLPHIKTIESGKGKLPNSKLLESLSTYLNEPKELIIKNIVFNDDQEYGLVMPEYLQYYIATEYVKGYTFDIFHPYYNDEGTERRYPCILTRKREAQVKILVGELYNEIRIKPDLGDERDLVMILVAYLARVEELQDFPRIREYRFVLDANDEAHNEIYKEYESLTMNFVKETLIMYLFDYKKCMVMKEHVFSGNPLKDR